MRKSFLFAFAATAMLCSCSQDEAPVANNGGADDNGLVKIEIGVANKMELGTRGTGTVGGTTVEENVWSGQEINVCMFNKGTLDYATEINQTTGEEQNIFDAGTTLNAPEAAVSGEAIRTDEYIKYYPVQGSFDFWGFHLDDAYDPANEPQIVDNADGTQSMVVPFVIDGSQDIMAAKAVPSLDDTLAVGAENADRMYSAYAARRNVQPNLKFEHLLTRLTFQVKGGDASVCEGGAGNKITVTAIKIKSKATGTFTIAYTGDAEKEQIAFDDAVEAEWLTLKQRPDALNQNEDLVALDETVTSPKLDNEGNPIYTSIGDALILAPADEYDIEVSVKQNVEVKIDGTREDVTSVYKTTFRPTTEPTFEAGKSYKVMLTLWGLSKITINTELTPWGEGEDIDLPIEDLM